MIIENYGSDDGPWATFTRGHVCLDQFAAACMDDGESRELLERDANHQGEDFTPEFICNNAEHMYMRKLTKSEQEDYGNDDPDVDWHDWCSADHPAGFPVTAFGYEP